MDQAPTGDGGELSGEDAKMAWPGATLRRTACGIDNLWMRPKVAENLHIYPTVPHSDEEHQTGPMPRGGGRFNTRQGPYDRRQQPRYANDGRLAPNLNQALIQSG